MAFNKACLYSQFEDLQLSMACSQVIWLCTVEDFITKAFIALNNLHDQSLLFQNYLLKLVRSRCIVIQIPPRYYSIFTAVENLKWRMDHHFDTFCGTKARFSLASSQENVWCSNKRLWEEGFKEVAMYQIVAEIHGTLNEELCIKNDYWKENRDSWFWDRTIENRRKGYKHRLFPLLCLFWNQNSLLQLLYP